MKSHGDDFADLLGRFRVRAGFTQGELAHKIGMSRNTIGNWENRSSLPDSRGQVLRLADELILSKEERKILIQARGFSVERWPTEVFMVPQQRDMFFTGREDALESLRHLLVPGSTAALTQAISGLGGIGKTATAVEYAYRFHRDYEAVLWLPADSWETLATACRVLADELGFPKKENADEVVGEVQCWLRKNRHWLLILDDVEDPQEILPKFTPTEHQGSILITTRMQDVEPLAQTRRLETLSEQDSVLFLLHRTKKVAYEIKSMAHVSPELYAEAQPIYKLLDGLPLALDQAGAYVLETGCSFDDYWERYKHRRAELLNRRGKRFIGHEASVATTFSLAFERVETLNLAVADVLRVCSLLHSEGIPEELFKNGAEYLGPHLSIAKEGWDEAVGILQDFSLVLRNTDTKTLSIHRLVQVVLQGMLSEQEYEKWIQLTVTAINAVFPLTLYKKDDAIWSRCDRLIPHILLCAKHTELLKRPIADFDLFNLLLKATNYLHNRGQLRVALTLWRQAIPIEENRVGSEHPDMVVPLNLGAYILYQLGNYIEAEPLYQRILHIYSKHSLEPDGNYFHIMLYGLGGIYIKQGKYKEAEALYQRVADTCEQTFGPDHPTIAESLERLAELYIEIKRYAEAEDLYQRIAQKEKDFSSKNLVKLYTVQGKYKEAEALYLQQLSIYERDKASDDTLLAILLHELSQFYCDQGRYKEAEPLSLRSLQIYEQNMGPSHPDLALILEGLAKLYFLQGRFKEAEQVYQRALPICDQHIHEQKLNPNSLLLAYLIEGLATIYTYQKKHKEAEPLYQRALFIYEQVMGPDYPGAVQALYGLANLYIQQRQYTKAEPLCQQALRSCEQALGSDHPATFRALYGLANLYIQQGRYTEAESLSQQTLRSCEQALGPDHLEVSFQLENLSELSFKRQKYEEAVFFLQKALHIREQVLGSTSPDVAALLYNLANLYTRQSKHEEAEIFYQRAREIWSGS